MSKQTWPLGIADAFPVHLSEIEENVYTPHRSPHWIEAGQTDDGRVIIMGSGKSALLEVERGVVEGWTPLIVGEPWSPGDLPDRIPEHAGRILHARVFRRKDGRSLRAELEEEVATTLPSRVPVTGRSSAAPPEPEKAATAVDLARARLGTEEEPGDVIQARVPMADVDSGDVVEEDVWLPRVWAGGSQS